MKVKIKIENTRSCNHLKVQWIIEVLLWKMHFNEFWTAWVVTAVGGGVEKLWGHHFENKVCRFLWTRGVRLVKIVNIGGSSQNYFFWKFSHDNSAQGQSLDSLKDVSMWLFPSGRPGRKQMHLRLFPHCIDWDPTQSSRWESLFFADKRAKFGIISSTSEHEMQFEN